MLGDIRRIAGDEIEGPSSLTGSSRPSPERPNKPLQKADAIEHLVALGVFAGHGQGRLAHVGGRHLGGRDD